MVGTEKSPNSAATRLFAVGLDSSEREQLPVQSQPPSVERTSQLMSHIDASVIGRDAVWEGPFGPRQLTYCDYTASGRSLSFIEDYISHRVLPYYANTHTTSSITGKQTTAFRREARDIVMRSVKASRENDTVIFCGSGSTSAIAHMVHYLGISRPRTIASDTPDTSYTNKSFTSDLTLPSDGVPGGGQAAADSTPDLSRPVVFVGPFEHHSNILAWRESIAQVVAIGMDKHGLFDYAELERLLPVYAASPLKIGSFSAASNVTGVLVDTDRITALLHRHGALAFWDYAAAAPHVDIDMNPVGIRPQGTPDELRKDGVFISPHKFVGGPQTPGVLVVKKHILDRSTVPIRPAGGTIFFVTRDSHRYLKNDEEREEGGTPAIVESIRCGLVFKLKDDVGVTNIHQAELRHLAMILPVWAAHGNIHILGPVDPSQRIAIVSFAITHSQRTFLHYNFVAALLNDLFGIQTRGGCACAGPYSLNLLGISPTLAQRYEQALLQGHEVLRPGYVRVNLCYHWNPEVTEFLRDAVLFIADHGHKFLPLYQFYPKSGEWKHKSELKFKERMWLEDISWFTPPTAAPAHTTNGASTGTATLRAYLDQAHEVLQSLASKKGSSSGTGAGAADSRRGEVLPSDLADLRWFIYPHEAAVSGTTPPTSIPLSPFGPFHTSSPSTTTATATTITTTPTTTDTDPTSVQEGKLDQARSATPLAAPKMKKSKRVKILEKKLRNLTGKAIEDFGMTKEGDRVLLGLSGGKDSLTLLHILLEHKKRCPFQWELGVCTVDPMTPSYNPEPLKEYVKSLGVDYFFESQPIIERAACHMSGKGKNNESICAWCSRMKRGVLYAVCRREGYNVLALGHHLDDFAETFVMTSWRNGLLRTMRPHYTIEDGDLRVIRPMAYVREQLTREFADQHFLPVILENCPACFSAPTERAHLKTVLAQEEARNPNLFQNILHAIEPLMWTTGSQRSGSNTVAVENARREILGDARVERREARRVLRGQRKAPQAAGAGEGTDSQVTGITQ